MPAAAVARLQPRIVQIVPEPGQSARKFEITCSNCNLRELCLPGTLCVEDLQRVEGLVYARRRVKRGEALFNAGDAFNAIYSIRSGFLKTVVIDDNGREQVTGFFMGGELLGMEGIGAGRYHAAAVALEDSEVCVMPFSLIEQMAREIPALQRRLHAVLAREIVRDHGVMMLLGSMRAEERLATFLLNLSWRFTRRGYSPSDFHLRMTREEIGSYLGLKLETVSRLFSRFQQERLIEVQQKHVRILDIAGLKRIMNRPE
ncbi:MAG TPA: fumarate/nitrate reduction transcriptional regulator Fnr [Burkholderiales bacterium]|jgi:CRP/FNR family transcriptional regulator|nr:fumarate/nitrate reduction transcriptional regulator Fnr [Burkholderiales bacterium]